MSENRKSIDRAPERRAGGHAEAAAGEAPREVAVEAILADRREAVLVHNGVRYRLRVTSNDKLILTK